MTEQHVSGPRQAGLPTGSGLPGSGSAAPAADPAAGAGPGLPRLASVVAVCAHPDDESFGLGAVLAAWAKAGTATSVLCFTNGEASTLGAAAADLGMVRCGELAAAAAVLDVRRTELLGYRDGHLTGVPLSRLAGHVRHHARLSGAQALLVFDEGGITGHPDHCRATAAALLAARHTQLAVIAWVIPRHVAQTLNAEFGTAFTGRDPSQIDLTITVDRALQCAAITCHASQATANPVLWRRLELLGNTEHLRYLNRPRPRRQGRTGRPG
jgi:LmbE family N-acetylglucosaminyl deacetylase